MDLIRPLKSARSNNTAASAPGRGLFITIIHVNLGSSLRVTSLEGCPVAVPEDTVPRRLALGDVTAETPHKAQLYLP